MHVDRSSMVLQLQSDALTALHVLMRGSFENQLSLAQIPDAFLHLRASLSSLGAPWHPAKSDLSALLNILSRCPGSDNLIQSLFWE